MPRRPVAVAVMLAVALAGRGDPEPAAQLVPGSATTAAAAPAEAPAAAMDALAVIEALKKAKLPVTNIAEQDENADPNNKLGRPGGYTSRASADVPGGDAEANKYTIDRGLVIEVFATVEDAQARSTYIQQTLKRPRSWGPSTTTAVRTSGSWCGSSAT